MGLERAALFRRAEFDLDLEGSILFEFFTERPGETMTLRKQQLLSATNGRDTVPVALPGHARGHLYRIKLGGTAAVCRLFGARIYAKVLDGSSRTSWQWYPIPVEPTSAGWQTIALPVLPTAAEFSTIELPIMPTPVEFSTLPLPMRESPARGQWVDLPLDE